MKVVSEFPFFFTANATEKWTTLMEITLIKNIRLNVNPLN